MKGILKVNVPKDIVSRWCACTWSRLETKKENRILRRHSMLLCGILREMRIKNHQYPNFMQKDDPDFVTFHTTLDNEFKSLRSEGIGSSCSRTEGISSEEEVLLLSSGVLNLTTPKGLLRAAFYYCGKCFCLRGGNEHRRLSLCQLKRLSDRERYVYTESSSKNKQGGLKQLRMEHKAVTVVANKDVGERCPMYILDKYIKKLPQKAKDWIYFTAGLVLHFQLMKVTHGMCL